MWYLRRQNKLKDQKLRELGENHVFPDGPIDDRDPRYKYVI